MQVEFYGPNCFSKAQMRLHMGLRGANHHCILSNASYYQKFHFKTVAVAAYDEIVKEAARKKGLIVIEFLGDWEERESPVRVSQGERSFTANPISAEELVCFLEEFFSGKMPDTAPFPDSLEFDSESSTEIPVEETRSGKKTSKKKSSRKSEEG